MYAYLLGPSGNYWEILFFSVAVGVSQMMLGATLTVTLMYAIKDGGTDKHIVLGAIGHFFMAQGILCYNYANGWSTPLRYKHRVIAHGILQAAAVSCTVASVALVSKNGFSSKAHGVTGQLSAIFTLGALALGPAAVFPGRYGKLVHMTIGIPTFILSTVSLCYGITQPDFKTWAGPYATKTLVVNVAFYMIFVFIASFLQYIQRIFVFKSRGSADDDD